MTKDKYLLSVIDNLIAPMTIIYFIYENYLHKDYSEYFQRVLEYYQTYMTMYDKAMKEIEAKGNVRDEFLEPLLLCQLGKMKNDLVKGFFEFLDKEIIQEKSLNYDIGERYRELMEKGNSEIDVYIRLIKELRISEELKG